MPVPSLPPNELDGTLIVVEGVSRSGKSTLLAALADHYAAAGRVVVRAAWNADGDISPVITELKRQRRLTPWTFCLLHLADFRATYDGSILPALRDGAVVLSDRYVYTSWVRDGLRRIPHSALLPLLETFIRPDAAFLLDTDLETVLARFDGGMKSYGFYGLGADLPENSHLDVRGDLGARRGSFSRYQRLQRDRYLALVDAGLLTRVDVPYDLDRVVALLPGAWP